MTATPKLTFSDRLHIAAERDIDKREARSLKGSPSSAEWVFSRAVALQIADSLQGRGWEVVNSAPPAYGRFTTLFVLRIRRAELESRLG